MLGITSVQLSRIETGASGISAETLDKAIDILELDSLEAYTRADLLPAKLTQSKAGTIEEALKYMLFFDQKGLSEKDIETLRPVFEMTDREIDRLKEKKGEKEK